LARAKTDSGAESLEGAKGNHGNETFTVPTLTFGGLYCPFVIGHNRRKILHFNVTRNPNAIWVVQQLREAWAYKQPHRFLLFDRDSFGADVFSTVRDIQMEKSQMFGKVVVTP
jgi:hypothetical protein